MMRTEEVIRFALEARELEAKSFGEKLETNLTIPIVSKTQDQKIFLKASLSKSLLLTSFTENQIDTIVDAMKIKKVPKNWKLVDHKTENCILFVVKKGTLMLSVKTTRQEKTLEVGDVFGELGTVYEMPESFEFSVKNSATTGEIWVLDKIRAKLIVNLERMNNLETIKKKIIKNQFINEIHTESEDFFNELVLFSQIFSINSETKSLLFEKGTDIHVYFFLSMGKIQLSNFSFGFQTNHLEVLDENCPLISRNDVIFSRNCHLVDAKVIENAEVICIPKKYFDKNVSSFFKNSIESTQFDEIFSHRKLFISSPELREELLKISKTITFTPKEEIIKEFETVKEVYFVLNGVFSGFKSVNGQIQDTKVLQIHPGNFFETTEEDDQSYCRYTVCENNVYGAPILLVFSKEELISSTCFERLQKMMKIQRKKTLVEVNNTLALRFEDEISEPNDLKIVQNVGVGAFGMFSFCSYSSIIFGLKKVSRIALSKSSQQQQSIFNEKEALLASKSCPFIMTLYKTFRDEYFLYFLTDFVQGGEFFGLLHKRATSPYLNLRDIKFYTTCVVHTLTYLHSNQIAYRDLKPENIMIDLIGYTKVIDFGSAIKFTRDEGSMLSRRIRTKQIVGTIEYCSPEIVLRKGHSEKTDIWSLGILLYEMIFKITPFKSPKGDNFVLKNIIEQNFTFPGVNENLEDPYKEGPIFKAQFDASTRDFLSLLLTKSARERPSIDQVLNHSWFDDIDTEAILQRYEEAPWLPDLNGLSDLSYFPNLPDATKGSKGRNWFRTMQKKRDDWDIDF